MGSPKSEGMKQISFTVKEYSEPMKPLLEIENGIGDMPFFNKHDVTVFLYLKDESDKNARIVADYLNKNIDGLGIVYNHD